MLVLCDKCNRQVDAKINKETNKPVCPECRANIDNLTSFAFNAMKNNREYLVDNKQSFMFPCKKCNGRRGGVVKQDGSAVICVECKEALEVSPFMALTMKNLGVFEGKTAG